MNKKYLIVSSICFVVSLALGILSDDILMGGTILLSGLLCAYFASEGKKISYLLGLVNYVLMGIVSLWNNLYGLFFFYLFIFSPLQIKGFLTWNKNLDKTDSVKVREFTFKNSIIITLSCIAGSLALGYLLTLIPGQQLAFMDASSNCINLCGVILMILRFKEAWWLWLVNNIVDLSIWIAMFVGGGERSAMMLAVSVGYLLINIYGIVKWSLKAKSEQGAVIPTPANSGERNRRNELLDQLTELHQKTKKAKYM